MTNFDIPDDIDEAYSSHATTVGDDIHYVETSNEWSRWRDELVDEMFSDWELRNHMTTTSRLSKHNWMKEEETCLVECLVKLVNVGDWRVMQQLNKSFPHYDELSYVFGKDRATEGWAETFGDVESNDPTWYVAFHTDAAPNMEFQPIYSQGLDMSPDEVMGTRTTRASEGRNVSSGSNENVEDNPQILRT
ncbi:retrotransposon protein [Cucumis melo var. makuwa]|uniref:Retrotransposon protein n=1 Tax=Cucumis melo var. makuwa TaxID=1194695 RepID=A0A5D3BCB2_CUCMM|nr:retrotransposon protein [Cucumis melo var. makuwa]TYJ96669.1 retrotransposon protein [Cucumis melo var. makuwa]